MFIDILSDILFPIECVSCSGEKDQVWLCDLCKVKFFHEAGGPWQKHFTLGSLDRCYGLFDYGHPTAQRIIHLYKYQFVSGMADIIRSLATYYKGFLGQIVMDSQITAVPLHGRRMRARGYNQAEGVASAISSILERSYLNEQGLLTRKRCTKPQTRLKRDQRLINMRDAFSVSGEASIKKRYVVVDDVVTTGATMHEVARVLKKNGAQEVIGITFAAKIEGNISKVSLPLEMQDKGGEGGIRTLGPVRSETTA